MKAGKDNFLSWMHFFETGQYDRFYIVSDRVNLRLTIQILPKGEKAIEQENRYGEKQKCKNKSALTVFKASSDEDYEYGIQSRYDDKKTNGWIHEGPWQDTFNKLVEDKSNEQRKELVRLWKEQQEELINAEKLEKKRVQEFKENWSK